MNATRRIRAIKTLEENTLKNRTHLLKAELEKTKKKLVERKKQAQKVAELKKKAEEALKQQNEHDKAEEEWKRQRAEMNALARHRQQEYRRAQLSMAYEQKKKDAQRVAEERKRFEALVKQERDVRHSKATAVRATILQRDSLAKKARHLTETKRQTEARSEANRRMATERAVVKASESAVKALEAEEARLIAELEKTQEAQSQAYNDLEKTFMDQKPLERYKPRPVPMRTLWHIHHVQGASGRNSPRSSRSPAPTRSPTSKHDSTGEKKVKEAEITEPSAQKDEEDKA